MAVPSDAGAPPGFSGAPIAGLRRRVVAFTIDFAILAAPALGLGLSFYDWAASLGSSGRWFGFIAALLYFGLFDSRLGGGQTPGKFLTGLRVTDRNGNALSPRRAILRFLIFSLPYFLYGLWFDTTDPAADWYELPLVFIVDFVIYGGAGALLYLFLSNVETRQSLHDLAVGSYVVRGTGALPPIRVVTPRQHLFFTACWMILALIGVGISLQWQRPATGPETAPLLRLQQAIRQQTGFERVSATIATKDIILKTPNKPETDKPKTDKPATGGTEPGDTATAERRLSTMPMATPKVTGTTIAFVQIAARPPTGTVEDPAASTRAIARLAFDYLPDLAGSKGMIITIRSGFDFGIVHWNIVYRSAWDTATWRSKLGR